MKLEYRYDAARNKNLLHFYDADDRLLLSLDVPEVTSQSVLHQLWSAWNDKFRNQDVSSAIRAFGQWSQSKEQPPLEMQKDYDQVGVAFLEFFDRESEVKDRFNAEFRSIAAKFRCNIRVVQVTDMEREIHFWYRSPIQPVHFRVSRLPEGDNEFEKDRCRKSCSKYLQEILQASPGTPEYDERTRLLQILYKLPYFFEVINLLNDESRYLREICLALLGLSQQTDARELFSAYPDLELEREMRKFVLMSEESPESLRQHLDDLLGYEKDYMARREDLSQIMKRLRQAGTNARQVRQIGTAFAEYYLSVYDFDSSADVLKEVLKYNPTTEKLRVKGLLSSLKVWVKELPVRLILRLAQYLIGYTKLSAVFCLLFVVLLMSPAVASAVAPSILDQLTIIAPFCFILLYIALIFSPILILWRSAQDRTPYYQFFFPRLFGAIIVGLGILVFEQTTWDIGRKIPLLSMFIIGTLAVMASKGYLQIDIHKLFVSGHRMDWKRAFTAASRLFWIGLVQSLTVATTASSLLSSALNIQGISTPVNISDLLSCFLKPCSNAMGVELSLIIPIGVYPTIVLLWTVIALFSGAFLQLLWQGVRATEPV